MLFLRDLYLKEFPDEAIPLDPRKIANWALQQGHWVPEEVAPEEVLRRKISRALRHEFITDPQNREVRAGFAAVEEVQTPDGPKRMAMYYPIFVTPESIAAQHFKMERRLAVENAYQSSLDLQSYNENNVVGGNVPPIDWNIGKDIDERNMPTDYSADPYGDSDDE